MFEMVRTPNVYCLVRGAGEGRMELNAFDQALLNAGIGDTNLVRMSSIVPPACKQIQKLSLPKGGLIPVAYAEISSAKPGDIISAAIACAIPEDDSLPGVIMEYEAHEPLSVVQATVEQMARDAFAYRDRKLKEVKSLGIEHKVQTCGAVFAGAVLWYE